jgi:hypothetical protein
MTRTVERSYLSLLLERDPEYYSRTRDTNRVEYRFSNGREFKGHALYSNYFPLMFPVSDDGIDVTDEGIQVYDEVSWEEYLVEFAV